MKQKQWHAVAILLVLVMILSIYELTTNTPQDTTHFAPNLNGAGSGGSVIFYDNFAEYPAGSANSASNPCNAPPDHTSVCQSPPKVTTPSGTYYWQPASSGTCRTKGGCATWQAQSTMGQNSVFSIVTEETMPDTTKSLKEGASDWAYDKTSAGVYNLQVPSGTTITLQFSVWFSPGVDNVLPGAPDYANEFFISTGAGKIVYFGNSGGWAIQDAPQLQLNFARLGNYHLSTQTWHTVSVTWDETKQVWDSLIVDGTQPFSQVSGYPLYGVGPTGGTGAFELFIAGGADYQSITSAPSQGKGWTGYYAYLDDVSVTSGGATVSQSSFTSSSTPSSSTATGTTSTETTTGSYTSGQTIWSADFETGDNSQFNNGQSSTCQNGVIGVSSTIVHSGKYAGMYSGQLPSGAGDCREDPLEALPFSLTDFHWSGWFYVPTQTLSGWTSFATFNYITSSNPSISSLPFTIDASPQGNLHLDITMFTPSVYVWPTTPTPFPFDSWFELSVDVHAVDTAQATISLSLNGNPILQYTGQLLPGPLTNVHFGAYFGGGQPSWTVYNDDFLIEALSNGSGTTTTTFSSVTTATSGTVSTQTSTQTSTLTSGVTTTVTTVVTTQSPVNQTVTSTVTSGLTTSTKISTVTSSLNSTATSLLTSVLTVVTHTNTLTFTQTATATSSQTAATTTTLTITGLASQVSYSYTSVTVTGESTSSLATTTTAIVLTTASVLTTVTQTSVTTSNILEMHPNSSSLATGPSEDALGFCVTLMLLGMVLVRRIFS